VNLPDLSMALFSTEQNFLLRAASVVVRLVQFTQVEHFDFDSIAAMLKSMGGAQAVSKTSKRTAHSLCEWLLWTAFIYAAYFLFGLVRTENTVCFYSLTADSTVKCILFVFVVRRFDYWQHWSCPKPDLFPDAHTNLLEKLCT